MKIAICDDEKMQREYLYQLVEKWSEQSGQPVTCKLFPSAEAFLFQYEEEKNFDLILLDIQMNGENGITLAKKIREKNNSISIIFVTGLDEFIGEGYEVSALHYLIKPIKKDKLFSCLYKAAQLTERIEPVIIIQAEGEMRKLIQKDIIMIEAFAHSCIITTMSENIETNKNLGTFEKELPVASFHRCHRSILVNLAHIEGISKTEVRLDNGLTALVSRRLYPEINQAFIRYNMKEQSIEGLI